MVLKYSVYVEKSSEIHKIPLVNNCFHLRVLYAGICSQIGLIKQMIRNPKTNQDEDEELDEVAEYSDLPKEQRKELLKIDMKIKKQLEPIPLRLESFEKSINILSNALNNVQSYSVKDLALIEICKAKRLFADSKGSFAEVWKGEKNSEDEENLPEKDKELLNNLREKLKTDSLTILLQTEEIYSQIDNLIYNKNSNQDIQKYCQQFIENMGNKGDQQNYKTFEYVCKMQNSNYKEKLIKFLKNSMNGKHRFVTHQRLIKHVKQQTNSLQHQASKELCDSEFNKLWNNVGKNIEYNESINTILPNSSCYVILQFSECNRYLYFSFLKIDKERNMDFRNKKIYMNEQKYQQIQKFQSQIYNIKSQLVKTPIIQDKDFDKIFNELEQEYNKILQNFNQLFKFVTDELKSTFIEQKQDEEIDPKAKKQEKKDKPKAGKGEMAFYESPIPLGRSQIESLVFLLDHQLFNLPFDGLDGVSEFPIVTRDFSLQQYSQRLVKIGYKSEMNNSNNINKSKLSSVVYNFKNDQFTIKDIIAENQKKYTNVKFEQSNAMDRIPSIGEWQKLISEAQLLLYYGNPALMYIMSPKVLMDMTEISKVDSFIIIDKINVRKQFIEKYNPIDQQGEKTSLEKQFINQCMLFSVLGVSHIINSQWCFQGSLYNELLGNILQDISQETYIGGCMNKFKEQFKDKPIIAQNFVQIGVPHLRLQ